MPLIQTAGRHLVTASNAQLGESDKGTPFVQITFTTESADVITGWLYLSEKAIERSVGTLREVFGFNGKLSALAEQIDGKPCSIVVENETGQDGKERLRVKWVNPVGYTGSPAVKPMANIATRLAELEAKMARIPAAAPKAAAPRPAAARPAPVKAAAPVADDGMPF